MLLAKKKTEIKIQNREYLEFFFINAEEDILNIK